MEVNDVLLVFVPARREAGEISRQHRLVQTGLDWWELFVQFHVQREDCFLFSLGMSLTLELLSVEMEEEGGIHCCGTNGTPKHIIPRRARILFTTEL